MSKNLLHESASSDALRLKALQSGFESRVEVNQRMLIDKMLARYSSDFVVCRELIQNSDDAKATSFHFEITCDNESSSSLSSEKDFHNKTITEICAINNGLIFNETDWKRVAAIAEGNTNVESVGQFGVGFFSVFSFSEEPIITSGNQYMAFVWRDDNSLTTYRHELPLEQQSQLTSIILKMRTKYILHTETNFDFDSIIDINENSNIKSPNKKRQKKSITTTTTTTNEIIPTINLTQLKAYFTKVLSFTKHINELIIKINQKTIFKVTKSKKPITSTKSNSQFKKNSIHNMLRLDSLIQTEQIFSIDHGPSITLNHISVDATLIIDENYHNHIRRILKKSLPPNVQIQLLYTPNNIITKQQQQQRKSSKNDDLHMKILNSLIPLKFQNDEIYPAGLIFIGLGTHQTTGIGMHVYSHLIPTIERENLDLQDPYISKWNRELLLSVGQIARFVFDQFMIVNKQYDSTLASYSFQPSVPNNEIGSILVDGFFSSNKDLLVPVKQTPTDINLSLIPSAQAYIANSKHIHSFLSLPLVPYELSKNGLFQALKDRDLIIEVNNELIELTITTTILLSNQFVEFLHWLSSQNYDDKQYIKRLLSIVRFRETNNSSIITLEKLKNYDNFNISTIIPLPSHVLPASVATYLSREELQKQLSLTPFTLKDFLHYYLLKNQLYLFTKENTSTCLLHIISKYSGQLNKTEWNKLKTTLSTITCIPTNHGMKIPNESYIPSSILSSDLPIITLNVPQNLTDDDDDDDDDDDVNDNQSIIENMENSISAEFLKRLGCRTLNVQSFVHARSSLTNSTSSSNSHTMKILIQHLMEERDNMSEGDFNALKQSECLRGTTLIPNKENTRKYAPQDLHFPFVAIQLQWSTLPIIDWHDIDLHSREYAFLKEIGVREVPDLQKLIDRIIEEHNEQKKKSINEYKLPIGLKFLAENFQQHYSKLWKTAKIKRPFLPSLSPSKTIILSLPEEVFKDESPLCATLLSNVIELFEEHFNISLLGVKDRPTLTVAFDILMEKKEEILNVETAPKIFAYMNQLDGLSRPLIERISKLAFIPLEGNNYFMKPSQVFIHPDNSTIESSSRLRQIHVILPTSSEDDDDDDEITQANGSSRRRRKRNVKTTPKNKKTKTVSSSSTPLIMDNIDKSGLIDYIDYGFEGNSFLLGIGVLHHPSANILAELLIDRQENYFKNLNSNNPDDLQRKLLAYTSCLRQLAIATNTTNELQSTSLIKRLKNESWCLGYQVIEKRSNNEKQRLFKIVPPNEIYLDDDHQCAIDLRPLLPPDEPELTKLYEKFGASWLSECVKRTLVHKGKIATSDRGNKLRDLIQYRLDMLFVNNRGEKMENLDGKHVDMLRTNLSVYEVDGIQCQLTFQKKTITLDSTDSSSCALEYDKNNVSLYFQKHIREFDYIDIASELARFVFKKPLDTIVHTISDKLASPLETLKRRGVPVDRLLQHNQQNIRSTIQMFQQKSDFNHNDNNHYHESYVEMTGRIEDFNRQQTKDDAKLFSMLKKGRAYTQTKFIQQEHVKDDIDHSCEAVPSANMTRYKDLFHSIPLYIERNVGITNKMLDQAKQLAWVLIGLANHVFKIPIETLHLYRDIDGARIAFNDRRALFYNLRYYEQVFADKVQPYLQVISPSIPIIHTIVNFYFILTCHELAHNLEMAHNSNFINHLETIAVKFMTEKDLFLQQFSFQNYI
ncbi:unnamed protein product [Rotaria sordida]|uniref:Uncharacterized protein n=3 Tax=Rotaria sordida TaxID=392033 RepID=A0A815N3H1_9BILA|nr:unnamed protein product [Rotaria sordida]